MTQVAHTGPGLWYPSPPNWQVVSSGAYVLQTAAAITDLAGERVGFFGRMFLPSRGSKTISSAGGKIHFLPGTVTFANGGTTLVIGIQDYNSATAIVEPDGTFDVSATLTGGVDTITTNTWKSVTMGSGTKTIAHGDNIVVVFDMTARAGVDTVGYQTILNTLTPNIPFTRNRTGGLWATIGTALPIVVIEFDDGTFGKLDATYIFNSVATETYSNSTNPDERGMAFRVPWNCKVDGIVFWIGADSTTDDFDINLYSDPFGTPVNLLTQSIRAEDLCVSGASVRETHVQFASQITLTANTDYCWAVKATAAGAIVVAGYGIADAAYAGLLGAGTQYGKAVRNDLTGAFALTQTLGYPGALSISSFDDGTAADPQLMGQATL